MKIERFEDIEAWQLARELTSEPMNREPFNREPDNLSSYKKINIDSII